jgi:hypothetical protein
MQNQLDFVASYLPVAAFADSFAMRGSKQEMNSKFLPAYYGAFPAETIRSLL